MKKEKISVIIGGIIAAIIIGVVVVQFTSVDEGESFDEFEAPKINDTDNDGVPDEEDPFIAAPRVWQTSGPFQIDKKQYHLGELVLIRIGALDPHEKGQIAFLMPPNATNIEDNPHHTVYITIPFDGAQKNTFNQYFKPSLSKNFGKCSKDDLIGNWTVVFRGTDYPNLKFEIIDKVVPGDEDLYEEDIC